MKQIAIGDKKIEVYDDMLSFEERFFLYTFALHSNYQLSRNPGATPESKKYPKTLQSEFNLRDIHLSKILTNKNLQKYLKENNLRVYRAYINLCLPSDVYEYHIDGTSDGKTCLYYMNMDWRPEWEGETMFSMDRIDIDYSSAFVPGRFIFFDPTIPHKSTQPSYSAEYHRFVLVLKLVNSKNNLYEESFDASDLVYDENIKLSEHEKKCIEFIRPLTSDLPHSGVTLFKHLLNTFYILKNMKVDSEVCIAGLFHSIFGTDYYQPNLPVDQENLKKLIGPRAFWIVNAMCKPNRTQYILENVDKVNSLYWTDMLYVFYANLIEQSYRENFDNGLIYAAKQRLDYLKQLDKL